MSLLSSACVPTHQTLHPYEMWILGLVSLALAKVVLHHMALLYRQCSHSQKVLSPTWP